MVTALFGSQERIVLRSHPVFTETAFLLNRSVIRNLYLSYIYVVGFIFPLESLK